MKFEISGSIKLGSGVRPFVKEIEAKTENDAREKILKLFGSQNGLKRTNVSIKTVQKGA
ncbi:TPA: 50S ribosomal protein L18a [Candidatus Micrarchaeota archaeon]|nr:50S ribosomal protein L18a [Candidatus Micrarchaeota archaeon]